MGRTGPSRAGAGAGMYSLSSLSSTSHIRCVSNALQMRLQYASRTLQMRLRCASVIGVTLIGDIALPAAEQRPMPLHPAMHHDLPTICIQQPSGHQGTPQDIGIAIPLTEEGQGLRIAGDRRQVPGLRVLRGLVPQARQDTNSHQPRTAQEPVELSELRVPECTGGHLVILHRSIASQGQPGPKRWKLRKERAWSPAVTVLIL